MPLAISPHLKGNLMPEITIDPQKIMQSRFSFDQLIWRIVNATKPRKTDSFEWYGDNGISDKNNELWELIE